MKKHFFLFSLLLLGVISMKAQRSDKLLRQWSFSRDGQNWQTVRIPHDWAISGPFDKKWDLQQVAIKENGETKATEKSGRSGALPWIGDGEYKTSLTFTEEQLKDRSHILVIDGAMAEPRVYVNGKFANALGLPKTDDSSPTWAYGYNAFRVDIAPMLKVGSNEIVVKLSNKEESSRWYPGAGLYRPVTLSSTSLTRIDEWSVFVRTSSIERDEAVIDVDCGFLWNELQKENLSVEISLVNDKGYTVAASRNDIEPGSGMHTRMHISKPNLWSPETPYLYKADIRLMQANRVIDHYVFNTGIRTVKVSKEGGFQLNGVTRKLKGVCLHHDLGPLGAAVNKAALARQIRLMKEMGADAIRTAHNMPSQWQMEICDSMGMMVMAESFDMWRYPKCKNGYARFFDEWSDRDIENLVRVNRNHPSIVMWSIGNEIPEQWSEEGRKISEHLQELCHQLDETRPVTQGMDKAENALKSGFAQVMDVPGFNYRVFKYPKSIGQLPKGFLLGSETASTVSSRGVYKFPVVVTDKELSPDGQCTSYDTQYCSWSNLPESDFAAMDDLDYTIGQFVWTGFDYLGEPTPYDEYWPSRSSYFGICDLAGLPKDRYYLYRSQWRKDEHTIHLLPHWTWPSRKGKVTPVMCYTDYDSAELFVNGVSQGKAFKSKDGPSSLEPASPDLNRYRLMWPDVKYQPGELKVVVFDKDGKPAGEKTVNTSGKPFALKLEADRTSLKADGDDLAFVTVSMTDDKGNLCALSDDDIEVSVEGNGCFVAVCNGDATSLEPFTQPKMKLFGGQLVVAVRSSETAGTIFLSVNCPKRKIENVLQISTR